MRTIEYDRTADALYVYLRAPSGKVRTRKVSTGVFIDIDEKNETVGIEILGASKKVPEELVNNASPTPRLMTLTEAEEESGVSAVTLRTQIHNGRLRAMKKGRDWFVNWDDVAAYLESRHQSRTAAVLTR
jgi:excisionase family DNA binding protein